MRCSRATTARTGGREDATSGAPAVRAGRPRRECRTVDGTARARSRSVRALEGAPQRAQARPSQGALRPPDDALQGTCAAVTRHRSDAAQSHLALHHHEDAVRALLQVLECHRCVCKLSLHDDSKRRVRGRSAKTSEDKDQWLTRLDLLAQLVEALNRGKSRVNCHNGCD